MDSTLPTQMLKDAGGGFTVDKENKGAQRAGEEARNGTDSTLLFGAQPPNPPQEGDTHSPKVHGIVYSHFGWLLDRRQCFLALEEVHDWWSQCAKQTSCFIETSY